MTKRVEIQRIPVHYERLIVRIVDEPVHGEEYAWPNHPANPMSRESFEIAFERTGIGQRRTRR